ncbi:MAG: hypothetical protein G01um101456_198 [Parcubacteria group bacterium Gr01-1014_56]|nr:MAG: hypothetical protein G01um101456_198 [Parcubacteria group bacterium Gr01-1014_56]
MRSVGQKDARSPAGVKRNNLYMLDPIRGSIWKSNVNSWLGTLFLASCALWAVVVIVQTAWGTNPVTNAFAAIIESQAEISY